MRIHVLVVAALVLLTAQSPPTAEDLGVPGKDGLVVCTSSTACDAGASVLARGGNAVDAAVATAFALAVTHPSAGNIGGGGYMLVRMASGRAAAIDYREAAVAAASAKMFGDSTGKLNPKVAVAPRQPGSNPSVSGYLSVALPGTVRGMELAH